MPLPLPMQVEVHGLLRERLLSGREALGGALTAARRAYEAVGSEDALPPTLTLTPTLPLSRQVRGGQARPPRCARDR